LELTKEQNEESFFEWKSYSFATVM
jgi:hypothetical protein